MLCVDVRKSRLLYIHIYILRIFNDFIFVNSQVEYEYFSKQMY